MDKIRAFEAFVAVVETQGFASAARQLQVSAPSVTRMVGELEAGLGVMLLQRTTRVVTVTDIGQHYYEDAKDILAKVQACDDAARGAHSDPAGMLRVTASSMFGHIYIAPIITQYLDRYENVSIDALFLDRVVNFREEGIDVSIRIGNLPDSTLMATRVGHVKLMVCGSPAYFDKHGIPKQPDDLKSHKTIGLTLGSFQAGWKFANERAVKLDHKLSFNTVSSGIEAAKSDWGLVRVLSYQVGQAIEDGALISVLDAYQPAIIPIHVIHGHGGRAPAKVRTFVDFAVETLRANPFINP
ncbi:LysR family transcriptional regulator [Hirschia litorea]|uniref:LysR family transcriptional regulator n=1 Tax=Hirschia litorea TaxID=1199156 RepID=A0ABW2IQA7_9PROT